MKLLILLAVAGSIVVVLRVVVFVRPWDPRLGAASTELALRAMVGGGLYRRPLAARPTAALLSTTPAPQ